MEGEINRALSSLQSKLKLQKDKVAKSLAALGQIYRWVFYVERVCSVIELRGNDIGCMLRWIDVFEQHEKNFHKRESQND